MAAASEGWGCRQARWLTPRAATASGLEGEAWEGGAVSASSVAGGVGRCGCGGAGEEGRRAAGGGGGGGGGGGVGEMEGGERRGGRSDRKRRECAVILTGGGEAIRDLDRIGREAGSRRI